MTTLSPVASYIKNTFDLYAKRENLIYLTKIATLELMMVLLVQLVSYYLFGGSYSTNPLYMGGDTTYTAVKSTGPIFILVAFVAFVWGLLITTATIKGVDQVVNGQILGIKQTLGYAWGKVWKYFITAFAFGIMFVIGLLFFVIPGIIIGVWFGFAIYIVVTKDIGIMDSFRESRELVRGRFMGVLGRAIVLILVTAVISIFLSLIPYIGALLATLLQPLFVLFLFLLYKDLEKAKASQSSIPATSS